MKKSLPIVAILAILATTTGLLTALSMMSETALAVITPGGGGGCGTGTGGSGGFQGGTSCP